MASGLTNFAAKAIANAVMNGSTLTLPATWYVALFTVVPTASGGGTEATYNNYSRAAVTANSTQWPNASGTTTITISNGQLIQFNAAGSGASATVVGWAIYDASTSGNMWWFGTMNSLSVSPSVIVQFGVGEIALELISTTP